MGNHSPGRRPVGGGIYAFNPDGSVAWHTMTYGSIVYSSAFDPAAASSLFVASSTGNSTSPIVLAAAGQIDASVAIDPAGDVYFGDAAGNLYEYTPGGANIFTAAIGGPILNAVAIVPQPMGGGYFLYFGTEGTPTNPGNLFEFNTVTLAALGFGYGNGADFSSFTTSSAAVDAAGAVYIGATDGSLAIW